MNKSIKVMLGLIMSANIIFMNVNSLSSSSKAALTGLGISAGVVTGLAVTYLGSLYVSYKIEKPAMSFKNYAKSEISRTLRISKNKIADTEGLISELNSPRNQSVIAHEIEGLPNPSVQIEGKPGEISASSGPAIASQAQNEIEPGGTNTVGRALVQDESEPGSPMGTTTDSNEDEGYELL